MNAEKMMLDLLISTTTPWQWSMSSRLSQHGIAHCEKNDTLANYIFFNLYVYPNIITMVANNFSASSNSCIWIEAFRIDI